MDLEVEVNERTVTKLNDIAGKLYPELRKEEAVSRIVEQALAVRLFHLHIGGLEVLEVEEPVGHWEFQGHTDKTEADIVHWLFKTG